MCVPVYRVYKSLKDSQTLTPFYALFKNSFSLDLYFWPSHFFVLCSVPKNVFSLPLIPLHAQLRDEVPHFLVSTDNPGLSDEGRRRCRRRNASMPCPCVRTYAAT